jgi:hypothetical protein
VPGLDGPGTEGKITVTYIDDFCREASGPFGPKARGVEMVDQPWGVQLRMKKKGPNVTFCMEDTPGWDEEDSYCQRYSGQGTWHAGAGKCSRHGGNSRYGNLEGWLHMVHAFADFQRITPWEALLEEVERTAAGLRFLDKKVGQATHDEDLLPDGEMGPWVKMRSDLQAHGLRVFKATMDVGIDRILAEQNRIDGERMAQVLSAGLEAGGLSEEQRLAITAAMRRALEAQSAQSRVTAEIEGVGPSHRGDGH